MKKYLILLICIFSISIFTWISCNDGDKKKSEVKEERAKESQLARGEYLVTKVAGCLDCHSHRQFEFLSGPIKPGTEGMGGELFDNKNVGVPGAIYARNITSDPETGIGSWTDEEVIRAMTQGISRNGDSLFPLMPYPHYSKMAKDDVLAVVAYIRTLAPIKNKVPQRQLFAPISVLYAKVPNTLEQNVKPAISDRVKYGEYLVNMASCFDCHTPMNEKGEFLEPFSGGYPFHMPTFSVRSANITPDSTTGIGAWPESQFLNKMIAYRDANNYLFNPGKANTFMPWNMYAQMDDGDLQAIFAYLKTVKPVKNKVDKYADSAKIKRD